MGEKKLIKSKLGVEDQALLINLDKNADLSCLPALGLLLEPVVTDLQDFDQLD